MSAYWCLYKLNHNWRSQGSVTPKCYILLDDPKEYFGWKWMTGWCPMTSIVFVVQKPTGYYLDIVEGFITLVNLYLPSG